MSMTDPTTDALNRRIEQNLASFVDDAMAALGPMLEAIVLYGSAAEGRPRPSSDVNLIMVLRELDVARLDALREALRLARATIRMEVMFVQTSELDELVEAFADKFADVARRRRVLYGEDPFVARVPSRKAQLLRLRQVTLNLTLRMRHRYLLTSLREEQAARAIAELAGPLRVIAADLLDLEGRRAPSPKEALAVCARELGGPDTSWLEHVSAARERRGLPRGEPARVLLRMLKLATSLHARTLTLSEAAP
jgi:predicted nucleotidyltransferase